MRSIIVIALNTFRENLRDKILYSLLIFAALLMGASILLGALTIAEQEKIIADMGLASINVIGVIIAIFVGIGLVRLAAPAMILESWPRVTSLPQRKVPSE